MKQAWLAEVWPVLSRSQLAPMPLLTRPGTMFTDAAGESGRRLWEIVELPLALRSSGGDRAQGCLVFSAVCIVFREVVNCAQGLPGLSMFCAAVTALDVVAVVLVLWCFHQAVTQWALASEEQCAERDRARSLVQVTLLGAVASATVSALYVVSVFLVVSRAGEACNDDGTATEGYGCSGSEHRVWARSQKLEVTAVHLGLPVMLLQLAAAFFLHRMCERIRLLNSMFTAQPSAFHRLRMATSIAGAMAIASPISSKRDMQTTSTACSMAGSATSARTRSAAEGSAGGAIELFDVQSTI